MDPWGYLLYPVAILGAALIWFIGEFWLPLLLFALISAFVFFLSKRGQYENRD